MGRDKSKYIFIIIIIFIHLIFSGCKENRQTDKISIDNIKSNDSSVIQADTVKKITEATINTDTNSVPTNDKITAENKKTDTTHKTKTRIVAYYFHPTARCVTCRNIEAYSIEAIQGWEEKTGNKVIWKELNIEDSVNEHYIKDYNLEFSSLVIAQFSGNKRVKWKNLAETWKLVNEKSAFLKYVNFELNQFVKK